MSITLRDATSADLLALTTIRSSEALHRGRLRDAQSKSFRYFVILHEDKPIGFVSLVFHRPVSWSNTNNIQHLPEINDFYITETKRGNGYGSAVLKELESITVEAGYSQIYLSVERDSNARAYALYLRLGYQPLQDQPYFHYWEAADGDGQIKHGEVWLMNMMKKL